MTVDVIFVIRKQDREPKDYVGNVVSGLAVVVDEVKRTVDNHLQ